MCQLSLCAKSVQISMPGTKRKTDREPARTLCSSSDRRDVRRDGPGQEGSPSLVGAAGHTQEESLMMLKCPP